MEAQKKPTKSRKRRSKTSEFVQDFLPVREIRNGIIETTDDRYVKIIEILPSTSCFGAARSNTISSPRLRPG